MRRIFFILIAILILEIQCISRKRLPIIVPQLKTNNEMTFKRDSLYISYTMKQFLITDYYNKYHPLKLKPEMLPIVDMILYSPDMTKMFSIVIFKYTHLRDTIERVTFDGRAFAGYRDTLDMPWHIYPLTGGVGIGYPTYKDCRFFMRKSYCLNFKNKSIVVKDSVTNVEKVKKFKYNVTDPEFWDSIIWQKGILRPGLYLFQVYTKPWTVGVEINPELPYLEIDYPDSVIAGYKELDVSIEIDTLQHINNAL